MKTKDKVKQKKLHMKRIILIFIMSMACGAVVAQSEVGTQTEARTAADDEVFVVVEDEPEFPGGTEALYQYLASNIKYPAEAKAEHVQGLVMVSFVIEKDGSVSGIKVLRDIGGGCGEEAVRVVRQMPRWKPGRTQGKRVRTQFNLPINFTLDK